MADQKVSNERKKELEQLDPFQENLIKTINFAKDYRKQLGLIAGGIILIAIVFSAIMYSFERSEDTASTMLSQALTSLAAAENPQKGYEKVKSDFAEIFKDYSNTAAGRQAVIEYAKICYDASRFDESYTYYKQALDLFENRALVENFILVSLGHVSLAKNDHSSAKKYFSQVETSKTDLLKDEALFALGLIDESSGNRQESQAAFEKLVADYETSLYYPLAKSKLDNL